MNKTKIIITLIVIALVSTGVLYFFSQKDTETEKVSTVVTNYPITTESETQTTKSGQYKIVETGQEKTFDNEKSIEAPKKGEDFYGQDAQNTGNTQSYTDNGDGTITDNVTGLVWQKTYTVLTYAEAVEAVKTFNLGGHTDWRIPTIKEAYSLIDFSGSDPSGERSATDAGAVPFINTDYFDFEYASNGDRDVDTQILSSTVYNGKTMGGDDTIFGVNVADGRIKGYPFQERGEDKKFTIRFVRGNMDYGKNNFVDNKNETITDKATGLMWAKNDSQTAMNWKDALAYVQQKNNEKYLGYSDWYLPNIKELQSIVDYSKSPQNTNSAAINNLFNISTITDEGGNINYPFFWSSTTHKNASNDKAAAYIAFGEALGFFEFPGLFSETKLVDVHGAGSQRSDPKENDGTDYSQGYGPQGDVVRIKNHIRLVRKAD